MVDAASLDTHAPLAQRAQSLDEFKKLGKVITGREQSDAETLEQMRRADKDRNALLRSVGFPPRIDRPWVLPPRVGVISCRGIVWWLRLPAWCVSVTGREVEAEATVCVSSAGLTHTHCPSLRRSFPTPAPLLS